MNISLGIFFGAVSMLSWGVSDFFIAKSVRGSGVLRAFLWAQLVSVTLLSIVFIKYFHLPSFAFPVAGLVLVAGILGVISNLSFYKSLHCGKVCIVMPIASCWAIITVLLSLLFFQEKLHIYQLIGVVFAIAGAALVSFKMSDLKKMNLERHAQEGVKYAVVAAFAYGTNFVLIDLLVEQVGWFLSVWFIEIAVVFYLLIYSGIGKRNVSFPKNVFLFVMFVGVLDAMAYLSYGIGVDSEYGSIVAPIAAASPAVSIVLAKIFFKENLEINQVVGIVFVLLGLVLLAV